MIVHALLKFNNMEYLLFYSFVTAGLCIHEQLKSYKVKGNGE